MPANPYLVGRAGLLGLDVDNKWRREEGPAQNKFCLLTRKGARHPTCQKLLLQIIMYFVHVRVGGRIVREDYSFGQVRHVTERKTMPQIVAKKGISERKAMFKKKRFKGM
jgi:hypothetical protein